MYNDEVLSQCFSDLEERFGGRKEDYFSVLYLADRFDLKREVAAHWCTFGGHDYGVDAYYIDPKARNLFLYQFKWSDSVLQMTKSIDRLVDKGLSAIFGNSTIETERNDIINRLRADIQERIADIDRVFIYFISKKLLPDRSENASLDSRLEELERATHIIREFFDRDVEIVVRVNDDAKPPPRLRFPITWDGTLSAELPTGETLEIGFVSPLEFADIYKKMGLRLLQKNIRAGLTSKTAPNRSLREAFLDIADGRSDPRTFVFRHNGISLEVSHLVNSDGITEVVEPRILNGAQTIATLARLLYPDKGTSLTEEKRARIAKARVVGKVIRKCSESFVTEVTISNNKQNPVQPWNLRACDRLQIDLEQRFKESVGLHYDRLQNSFAAKGQEEWEEEGIKPGKVIEIRKLAMTLAASQGEIDRLSRMPDVFEQETLYKDTFQQRYVDEDFDLRAVVLAYKVQYCLRMLVEEIAAQGTRQFAFISRARTVVRNLVWALAIQALLNDPNYIELLEDYGTDLRAGDDFKERLRKVARGKLAPILSNSIKSPSYAKQLADEKYSFLKTNGFYRMCMSVGFEKFRWSRKRL
jgi:hypothetical protein